MTGRTLWLASVVAVGAALGWIGAAAEQRPVAVAAEPAETAGPALCLVSITGTRFTVDCTQAEVRRFIDGGGR